MKQISFLKHLHGSPLLCDGAMGTELIARGLPGNQFSDTWNDSHPKMVRAVHQSYIDAGCDCITTNTFGGSFVKQGAAIARAAAGSGIWVLGNIGPADSSKFPAQANVLHDAGCDAVIIETMTDSQQMCSAIRAAKAIADWPVIASFTFGKNPSKLSPADASRSAMDSGADVVGTNCGIGMNLDDHVRLAEQLMAVAKNIPVIVQPSAGEPRSFAGKLVYPVLPIDMSNVVPRLLAAGVRMIGGCCGTTPGHLRAMRLAMGERCRKF